MIYIDAMVGKLWATVFTCKEATVIISWKKTTHFDH